MRELIDVTARPLLIISKRPGSGRAPEDWKKADVTSVFKMENVGNYSLISLIAIIGKMSWKKIVSEEFSKHTMENVVMRSS